MRSKTGKVFEVQLPDFSTETAHLVSEATQSLWFDFLIAWFTGRKTISTGLPEAEMAIRAVVAGAVTLNKVSPGRLQLTPTETAG